MEGCVVGWSSRWEVSGEIIVEEQRIPAEERLSSQVQAGDG